MATQTTQSIGKVVIVYGTVKAVSPAGVERLLTPNSPIYANDRPPDLDTFMWRRVHV